MVIALHLLLAVCAIPAGPALYVFPEAPVRLPAARLGVALAAAAVGARPGVADVPVTRGADASGSPGDDAAEGTANAPIGRFLMTLKGAIPWVAGLLLVGALAVVVATCWLRQGVLTQNLSAGRGRIGAAKPKVDRRAVAEYLARVEKRRAAEREKEGGSGAGAKGTGTRPAGRQR